MKNFVLTLMVSSLVISGVALAQQSGKQEEGSRTQDMMEEMMKGGKEEGRMDGMMRMMKMMEQCSAMMESSHAPAKEKKESRNQ